VAVLLGASTTAAATTVLTLGELAHGVHAPAGQPGTIVVGEVVKLRAALASGRVDADEWPAALAGV
jgi:siroheme synthase